MSTDVGNSFTEKVCCPLPLTKYLMELSGSKLLNITFAPIVDTVKFEVTPFTVTLVKVRVLPYWLKPFKLMGLNKAAHCCRLLPKS